MRITTRLDPNFEPIFGERRIRPIPMWPAFSIGLLLVLSALFPPLYLTVMNGALVALALAVAVASGAKIGRELNLIVVPFAVMLLCGAVMGVGIDRYLYLKDGWYIGNPALVMLAGYVFARMGASVEGGLRAFIYAGFILSFWQLRAFGFQPELLLLPAETIRRAIGFGHFAPIIALMILFAYWGRWRSGLGLPGWFCSLVLVVCSVAAAGTFSRTQFFCLFIGLVAAFGGFARREIVRVGLPLAAMVAFLYVLQLYVDTESDRALLSFFGKLARTGRELLVSDYNDLRNINLSYRGFETAVVLKSFAEGTPLQILFGRGLGYLVDLGVYLPLDINEAGGRSNVRFISVLHNGYLFVLMKTGLVAILAYAAFLLGMYLKGRQFAGAGSGHKLQAPARILQATAVTLAATTYVTSGAFNKSDMFPVMMIMGFLLYFLADAQQPGAEPDGKSGS
jgi:O-Antigen ligase